MKSIAWARGFYLAGVVLSVLLFLPQSWFPLMVGKVAAAALCLLAAGALYVWALWRGEAEAPPAAALLVALLPLAYLLSWVFSADRALGVLGAGVDTDTLFFMTLLSAAAVLGSALFRTAASGWLFLRVLFVTLLLAALFQAVVLLGWLPGPFADHSVNLIGKWNDFGVMALLLSFLLLVELEFGGLSGRLRAGGWVVLAALLVMLSSVNLGAAWGLLLAAAVVLAAGAGLGSRRIAWSPLAAGIVAVAFLFFGAALNAQLSKVVPVSSLEVRPSLQSTFDVTAAAHGASVKNAALGTGPNTFGLSWLMHKPAQVNQSAFWNLDFVVGFSTLATALSSVGLLGALAWLLPALLVLLGLWHARGREGSSAALTLGGGALLLWGVIALYVPSPSVLLVAFACAGAALGLLWRNGRFAGVWTARGVAAVLVVALLWTGIAGTRRFVAEASVGQAAAALQANDIATAQSLGARSVAIEPSPENLRFMVSAGGTALQQIAGGASSADAQTAFANTLQQTIAAGQRAIALDGQDYRSYTALGQVYALLAANQVQGAYNNAKTAYDAAAALSPLNPTIPLMRAQLEGSAGTLQGLQDALRSALTLKPDYTDAILLLAQVDIAQKDLASAIRDTQIAVQTAPGVPSIWFELGLLYYSNNDTKDAIAPLEQALKLQPDYANAQYFLGICYAAQGRTQDALALFLRLAQTNPASTEVQTALANLQAGRQPLQSATTTPVGAKPAPKK
jgi:tetratricopeptide (TPR) repeat protein